MSRLNFKNLGGFLSIELVTAATVPPASQGGRAGSFERHLEQARQTVERTTGAAQPPPADRRPEAARRQAAQEAPSAADRQADTARSAPGSPRDDPSTSSPAQSDSDGQADAGDAQSDAPQAGGASDTDGAPDKQSEPDDGQLAVGSPPVADALAVIASAKPSDQEDGAGVSAVSEEETEGKSQAEKPTQQTAPSDTTGQLVPGETEQGDAEAASLEDATAGLEADGKEGIQVDEEERAGDRIAQQSKEPTKGGQNADDAGSDDAGPSAADPIEVQEAKADSRRKSGRHDGGRLLAESRDDNPTGQSAGGVAPEPTQQTPSTTSQTEAPDEIKSEAGGTTTAVSTPTDGRGGETAVPPRVNQPIRQTSPGSAQGTSGPDQVDRVRFVQRVARAFEAMGDRGGSVRLRLHPPELGSLRLEVTVRNGTMTARLEVETNSARTMLLDNLPALRDRLAGQEIKVGRFDVDLSDRSGGGTPQGPGDHPQPHDHPDRGSPHSGPEQEIEAEGPPQPRAVVQPGQGSQLDVVI
ncbi:MAG TPA: flagellar hook-length control protein FliK [Thermoguttaceae bacterium]|nr:flagellar hook-length control protein FliK [Thermoguttaceae bacterium]